MNNLLSTVLSLSLSGSILFLLLTLLRVVFINRVSHAVQYYIYLLVLLRLAVPVTLEQSLISQAFQPEIARIVQTAAEPAQPHLENIPAITGYPAATGEPYAITAPAPIQKPLAPPAAESESLFATLLHMALQYQSVLWLCGVGISILWFLVSYLRFSRILLSQNTEPHPEDAALLKRIAGESRIRLYCNPCVSTPMLVGVLSPKILVPPDAFVKNGRESTLTHILMHELTHARRKDILFKWLAVLVTSLHWFNPLMLLLRKQMNRACELACDEAMIARLQPKEREEYGETLLSIAQKSRSTTGLMATTMCEEKATLKERLYNVVNYKKPSKAAVLLSCLLVLLLAGCGVGLGAAVPTRQETDVMADSPSTSQPHPESQPSPQPTESPAPAPDITDFDGDGLADYATATTPEDPGSLEPAVLTVSLGNGETIETMKEGWWWSPQVLTGDVDGDGKDEIVLAMEVGGTNYGAIEIWVYRVEGTTVHELSGLVITPPELKTHVGSETFELSEARCVNVSILQAEKETLLRIRTLRDYDPGAGITTAYYTDLKFIGTVWEAQKVQIGEAYGPEYIFTPVTPVQMPETLPRLKRDGFKEAMLTVIGDTSVDIMAEGYDAYSNTSIPSLYVQAQEALRQLYDMTGILVERCNIDTRYPFIVLTMLEDGDHYAFLTADIHVVPGSDTIPTLNIAWRQEGREDSPLDPAQCVRPANFAELSPGELAQWYYEHSSFGTSRLQVARTEEVKSGGWAGYVKLHLENGEFYEVTIDEATGLPGSFYGPYEEGFTH